MATTLSHICLAWLGLLFYGQFAGFWFWASAARSTVLKVEMSHDTPGPFISGDSIAIEIKISHVAGSQAKAVDAKMTVNLPFYLQYTHHTINLEPSSFERVDSVLTLKFDTLLKSQSVVMIIHGVVDPVFMGGDRDMVTIETQVDLWYYGEDGPCSRPESYWNAEHVFRSLKTEFMSCNYCDQRVERFLGPLNASGFFSSSSAVGFEAKHASQNVSGAWVPADVFKSDLNQFLQIDFERLIRFTKIEIRGQETPEVAYVRSFNLHYSKDMLDWDEYRENGKTKVFEGNRDGATLFGTFLPVPVVARYIRIVPKSWKKHTALKVQAHGCPVHPDETLRNFCPIFDFESGLSGWTKTGTAFDNQPTVGDNLLVRANISVNMEGQGWIGTEEDRPFRHVHAGRTQGGTPTGTLTSPKFMIPSSKLYFLIGGSSDAAKARAELLVDGAVVHQASKGSWSEDMREMQWDVSAYRGKEAVLRLVDDSEYGHLMFDALRADCYLDADAADIVLPSRSIMLDTATHTLYACDSSHSRPRDYARCRMTSGDSNKWHDIPDVLGLLGVDEASNKLYAIADDRYIVERVQAMGHNWHYITRAQWEEFKALPTMKFPVDVPWPSDGNEIDDVVASLTDTNGDIWTATVYSLKHKPSGLPSYDIAKWYSKDINIIVDPCVSGPCVHSNECIATSNVTYNCTCLPGYTGQDCEQEIDMCVDHSCLNDARCINDLTKYFCLCKYGYTGRMCEIPLPSCPKNPCLNGGTCEDVGPNEYRCACTGPYRGEHCEILFDECSLNNPCQNDGRCIFDVGGISCECPDGFSGDNCEIEAPFVKGSNSSITTFAVIETRVVTDTHKYLVIRATIPSDGVSTQENWCRDYENLCYKQGNHVPTGFGRSYFTDKHASCQREYFSFMDKGDILGSQPNVKVAAMANSAGLAGATPSNSFAFAECDEQKCSKVLATSGCDPALGCISTSVPNLEVYTVCVFLRQEVFDFDIKKRKWIDHKGNNLLLMNVKPVDTYSRTSNWCEEYQVLCDTYGLRTIGTLAGSCQSRYNAMLNVMSGNNLHGATRQIGFATYTLIMGNCDKCSSLTHSNSESLPSLSSAVNHYSLACLAFEESSFKVLDEKRAVIDGVDYLALRLGVLTARAKQANWCTDYQTLCESYGRRPVGCGVACNRIYNSVGRDADCPSTGDRMKDIANNAGFLDATAANSFALNSCAECSSMISSPTCAPDDIFCMIGSDTIVYTACVAKSTTMLSKLVKRTTYKSKDYVVIYASLPKNGLHGALGLGNWCEEYEQLCTDHRAIPTGCGNVSSDHLSCGAYGSRVLENNIGCNATSEVVDVALSAGFTGARDYNTFAFSQCSQENCSIPLQFARCNSECACHPSLGCIGNQIDYSNPQAYAICEALPDFAFEVLETKPATYKGQDVLVVKARMPNDRVSLNENWCEDYRRMCFQYGYRPVACGYDYVGSEGHLMCRTQYHAVMSETDDYTCPPDQTVSLIANSAGYPDAGVSNSFALSDCATQCVRILTPGNSFIDLSTPNDEVYTVCASSNSNFRVFDAKQARYNAGNYLFVAARVPQDFMSKHSDWCVDYERMCESYGMRPVSPKGDEKSERIIECRHRHKSVNPIEIEATDDSHLIAIGAKLGYSNMVYGNTINLWKDCSTDCYNDLKRFNSDDGLVLVDRDQIASKQYEVYLPCASSDSNFNVLRTKTAQHDGQSYLVVMASLPANGESKYESWCKDYERLCRTFLMRPTGCGFSNSLLHTYRSCVDKFQSAMAHNNALGCGSGATVANIAKSVGFAQATDANSFMFHKCSASEYCPRKLTNTCPMGLRCLTAKSKIVYTVCTDSSSAFDVRHAVVTQRDNMPLSILMTELPDDGQPRVDWCVDYQRLCESYGAYPVACDVTKAGKYAKCSSDYNAIGFTENALECPAEGSINQRAASRVFGSGEYFSFDSCPNDCSKALSSSCNKALNCLKTGSTSYYTACSRLINNFEIISVEETTFADVDVHVILASLPSHGQSLYGSWCEDYENLCSARGMRPLACPTTAVDTVDEFRQHSCVKKYNGYSFDRTISVVNTTMDGWFPGCPANDFVNQLAHNAGIPDSQPDNSVALSYCSTSCGKEMYMVTRNATSYLSMSTDCPDNATCEVWTPGSTNVRLACVKPPPVSSFTVLERVPYRFRGRDFTIFRVTVPNDGMSLIGDWCEDYRQLCASAGMRPIAAGISHSYKRFTRDCRVKYNGVKLDDFDHPARNTVRQLLREAGFNDEGPRTFTLHDCGSCGASIRNTGVYQINNNGVSQTVCINSDSAFEVLQKRSVNVDNRRFMVIKALLPDNMLPSHETWCKDYQKLCETYAKRPLACTSTQTCKLAYNALSSKALTCDSAQLADIAQQAGFPQATADNTFVFRSCDVHDCSRRMNDRMFGELDASPARPEVYTVCLSSDTSYNVIATREFKDSGRPYLTLRVNVNSFNAVGSTWCHDYTELCSEYGYRPVTTMPGTSTTYYNAVRVSDSDKVNELMARGMTDTTKVTNIAMGWAGNNECKKTAHTGGCHKDDRYSVSCYDRTKNRGEFTALCRPSVGNRFPVVNAKPVWYGSRRYTVVQTRRPTTSSYKHSWCHDYKYLCVTTFRLLPLTCPLKYMKKKNRNNCIREYNAVAMDNVDHGCPLNDFVSDLARSAGFSDASPQNSFAFNDCEDANCARVPIAAECEPGMHCLPGQHPLGDIYTVCTHGDSAFAVLDFNDDVDFSGRKYAVIKVRTSLSQKPLSKNWCYDYKRLCESFDSVPIECYQPDSETTSYVCRDSYGAVRLPCGHPSMVDQIANHAGFHAATSDNTFAMHKCTACRTEMTDKCQNGGLRCAKAGTMYAVCHKRGSDVGNLVALHSVPLTYGNGHYIIIQTELQDYRHGDWRDQYVRLCDIYQYSPIACGQQATSSSSSRQYCVDNYNVFSAPGDDFSCPPYKTIHELVLKHGFPDVTPSNCFAFDECSATYSSWTQYLPISSCYAPVNCLNRYPDNSILYTMCARPAPDHLPAFQVLDKRPVTILHQNYLAVKVRIHADGTAFVDNWCMEYRELCRQFNMAPTGCGSQYENNGVYKKCRTAYESFMPHTNRLKCDDSSVTSEIVRKAGFRNATRYNTFVFNRCDRCVKQLAPTPGRLCDWALNCLHTGVPGKEAYTICHERTSGFEVISSSEVTQGGTDYLVVEAALPADGRAVHDNWCQDYQKLCYSYGMFPVACAQTARNPYSRFGAVEVNSLSCPPSGPVVEIAKAAGYSQAKNGNTFVFEYPYINTCSKTLPLTGCTPGLGCLNSGTRVVHALCTNPTSFHVEDSSSNIDENRVFTVIKARLPPSGTAKAATWCHEYTNLCNIFNQQPVVCSNTYKSSAYTSCRDDHDAKVLSTSHCFDHHSTLHKMAQYAGFAGATLDTTLAMRDCSAGVCHKEIQSVNAMDPSLISLKIDANGTSHVYAVCLKESAEASFDVLDTRKVNQDGVSYLAIKARIPSNGKARHKSWCEDYQRLCTLHEMRPVRCSNNVDYTCLATHNAMVAPSSKFPCGDKAKFVAFLNDLALQDANADNSFIYGACSEAGSCGEVLSPSVCDQSLGCLKLPNSRVVYTVCARGTSTGFSYREARPAIYEGSQYLVIKTTLTPSWLSTGDNWCYDARDMCREFDKQPFVAESRVVANSREKTACFSVYNGTTAVVSQNNRNDIVRAAGYDKGDYCALMLTNCHRCSKSFVHCPFQDCRQCPHHFLICM